MTMFATQYPNNSRTVVGTPILFNDDCILLCDTNVGPVTINLSEIAQNYWNTTWKLYVVDKSGNASTNNITINAGVGQTINNSASLTISTNNESVLIRVVNNSAFIATSTGGGGTSGHIIQDEGVSLPQRPFLNFVGPGVTASDVGGKTQVYIPGVSLISLTNAAMLALIGAGTVVPGQFYLITDAGYSNGGVVVQGITTESISLQGSGLFLNADYQNVGDYSSVSGYVSQLGIWYSGLAPVVGDVVIWNNNHYKNLTGVVGTAPSTDVVNWALISRSQTTGYILEVDFVKYDVNANKVVYRADKRLNEVDLFLDSKGNNTLLTFQFGFDKVIQNKVLGSSSYICANSNAFKIGNIIYDSTITDDTTQLYHGLIRFNTIVSSSILSCDEVEGFVENNVLNNGTLTINALLNGTSTVGNNVVNSGLIDLNNVPAGESVLENFVSSNGRITVASWVSGSVEFNNIDNYGGLIFNNLNADVSKCSVSHRILTINNQTSTLFERTFYVGYSNFQKTLDLNDIAIYSAGVLTINVDDFYIGEFYLDNGIGNPISQIFNYPTSHRYKLIPTSTPGGNTIQLVPTAVGVAVAGDIITTAGNNLVISNTASYRAIGCDYFTLEDAQAVSGIIEKILWA